VVSWTKRRHLRCLTISWWTKEDQKLLFHSSIDSFPNTTKMVMAWSQKPKLFNSLKDSLELLRMTKLSNWFSKSLPNTIKIAKDILIKTESWNYLMKSSLIKEDHKLQPHSLIDFMLNSIQMVMESFQKVNALLLSINS
jgi:hypothetical protein